MLDPHQCNGLMTDQETSELLKELRSASERYWTEFQRRTRNWRPVPFVPLWLNGRRIGALYMIFHLLLLVTGGAFVFAAEPLHDLGLALVVGALFALGAGGAQVWAVAQERQRTLRERTLGEGYFDGTLVDLGRDVLKVIAEIESRGIRAPRYGNFEPTFMYRNGDPLRPQQPH
jgi:hypothetical protein